MKKFLFTLDALLMAGSAFARSDARYLFVNSDLTYVESETSMILTVSAEFPAYCSAFEANVITPEGMTVTMITTLRITTQWVGPGP